MFAATPAVDGLNAFAGDLYQQLSRNKGNLVFSPLSISTALAMTLAGARGQTAKEMTAVLRVSPTGALLEQLSRTGNASGDQLLLAQSLWVDREFALLPEFVAANRQQFAADPRLTSFSTAPEEARAAINRWVSEQTKSKIAELFPANSLKQDTRLVLASAVYFNGKWQSKFDPKSTTQAPFHPSAGAAVQTAFMQQSGRFLYAETANAQVLELPYAGGSLVFDVILPQPGQPLGTLELSTGLGTLMRKQVAVSLPKFRAETKISLQPTLAAMGMPTAFTTAADFSGIAGRRNLAISQVLHKAFIDVSEEGTEAAAATGVGISLTSVAVPVIFRADRPFLFLLRDSATGAVLFAGRLDNPKS
jgi:serpin B